MTAKVLITGPGSILQAGRQLAQRGEISWGQYRIMQNRAEQKYGSDYQRMLL